jgi:hypothetical protein
MSAYIVHHEHISALVNAADRQAMHRHGQFTWYDTNGNPHELSRTASEESMRELNSHPGDTRTMFTHSIWGLGQLLLDANVDSVAYRYPDDKREDLPGPIDYQPEYRHTSVHVTPVATIKAARCYRYQSCEHPTWKSSTARSFVEALIDAMLDSLPGYDDAPWEIVSGDAKLRAVSI